jgi:drug/metabolite transporter (DMT)-like permease
MLAALSRPARGAVAMVTAMASFIVNDACTKLAAAVYTTGQVLVLRGGVAILTSLAIVMLMGSLRDLAALRHPSVLLRGLMEGIIAAAFIFAIAHLPLANITSIILSASLVVVALAALTGMEQIGWRRWSAIAVGFAGALLVVRPGLEGFTVYSLVALGCALMVAVRDLITRRIRADIPSSVIAVASTVMVSLVGMVLSVVQGWRPIVAAETNWLLLAGVLVSIGNLCITIAFRDGDVTTVSALRYTVLLFSLALGYLIWGDFPDTLALIGAGLIVASGIYALHRQRVKAAG